jgi:hypothetical protein
MDEMTQEWRRLHNEELHALYFSPNIIRVIRSRRLRWAGHTAHIGRAEMHTGNWGGGAYGRRSLGRLRRTRENNIKIDL